MRFFLLLALLGVSAVAGFAQSNSALMRSGNKHFDRGNFRAAIPYYEQVIKKDPAHAAAYYFAGISYMAFDKEKAADYVYQAQELKPNVDRDLEYWLGRIAHINYNFDEAIELFEEYTKKLTRKKDDVRRQEVSRLIQHAQNAKKEIENPRDVFVKNLGSTINTLYSEHSPVISSDDNYLLFTSRGKTASGGKEARDGEYYEDIFESRRIGPDEWEEPRSLAGNLSSSGHDASIQLYDNDTKLLLYRQQNNGDIMYSERGADGQWGTPKSIGSNINTLDYESDAFITRDGQTLYYSTSHYSPRGDLDIYVSKRQPNGEWGKPVSIGNTINSPYDDDSPYLADDGVTLYFSSRGHNTMGGYDIFMSKYDSLAGTWSKPENMGAPINTPDDDTYYRLSPDGSYAYLSSYRIGGYGEKDIYTINYLRQVRIAGQVLAQQDSSLVPGIELVFRAFQADKRPISYRGVSDGKLATYEVNILSGRTYEVDMLLDGKLITTVELKVPVITNDTTSITHNFLVPVKVQQKRDVKR